MKHGLGKDQSQDEAQKAAEKAKAGHAVNSQATHAAGVREQAKHALERVREAVAQLKERSNELQVRADAAGQSIDHAKAPQHARDQAEDKEWQEQIRQMQASLAEAINALSYAAASIASRQEGTEQRLRRELAEKAAKARDADLHQGRSADEVTERQQRRDEAIEGQMMALAKHDLADTARLEALAKKIGLEAGALVQSLDERTGRTDSSNNERLAAARQDNQRFEEAWRASLAMTLLFEGRFSDIEAVQRTWDQAANGQTNDADGFAKARQKFWELVNARHSDEARETHRLLSLARVEWGKGSEAPLLDMHSESVDRIRDAAQRGDTQAQRWDREMDRNTRLSIDHVADKSTNRSLTLAAANLRFTTQADNSARGASYGVNDRRKADFERSEQQQVLNEKRRDSNHQKTAGRIQDALQEKEIVLAPERLREVQKRLESAHGNSALAASERHDRKLAELRDTALERLDGESEAMSRTRQQNLVDALDRFQQSGRAQFEALKTYEQGLHERQQQALRKALEALDAAPTRNDATQQLVGITKRLAEERRAVESLWSETARQQSHNEALLLQAIYRAESLQAQEEQLKHAFAEQEKTRALLEARLDDARRNEQMDH